MKEEIEVIAIRCGNGFWGITKEQLDEYSKLKQENRKLRKAVKMSIDVGVDKLLEIIEDNERLHKTVDDLLKTNHDTYLMLDVEKNHSKLVEQQLSNKEAIIKEAREHVVNAGVNTLMGGHKDKLLEIFDRGDKNE